MEDYLESTTGKLSTLIRNVTKEFMEQEFSDKSNTSDVMKIIYSGHLASLCTTLKIISMANPDSKLIIDEVINKLVYCLRD